MFRFRDEVSVMPWIHSNLQSWCLRCVLGENFLGSLWPECVDYRRRSNNASSGTGSARSGTAIGRRRWIECRCSRRLIDRSTETPAGLSSQRAGAWPESKTEQIARQATRIDRRCSEVNLWEAGAKSAGTVSDCRCSPLPSVVTQRKSEVCAMVVRLGSALVRPSGADSSVGEFS